MDLREFIQLATEIGELKLIQNADWNLEIGAVTDINAKRRKHALLFDNIKDYPPSYKVLTCCISSPKRISHVLGLGVLSDHHEIVSKLEGKPADWEKKSTEYEPKIVQNPAFLENKFESKDMDLFKFPTPRWHEKDGGRYIGTGGTVITKDPDTGVVNLGTYRVMIHDKNTLGVWINEFHHGMMHIKKYHAKGKAAPVVLSFGHDPLLYVVSGIRVPYTISELNYAGAIRGESIPIYPGPITGLPIPASSEIAVEGMIEPNELKEEGPFGEFTGYYAGGRSMQPVIHALALYHRDQPIILGSLPAKPPFDHSYFRSVLDSALIKDSLQRAGITGVQKVWRHESGCSNFWTVVSIRQQYPGHAKQAGFIAATCAAGGGYGRYVIVVDDDIDPADLEEVTWAISTRSDPATKIDIVHDAPSGPLDPLVRKPTKAYYSSRAVINACRPFEWKEEFPEVVAVSPGLSKQVVAKWPDVLQE